MMRTHETIPAEAERPCDCCGRVHRKLYHYKGFWMGETCKQNYQRFENDRDPKSLYWRGYERIYRRVARMFGAA